MGKCSTPSSAFSFQGKETVQFQDDCFSPGSLEEAFNQAAPNEIISLEENKAQAGFLPSPSLLKASCQLLTAII